jgi:hypothetical protein
LAKIITLQNSLPQEEIYAPIRVGIAVAKPDEKVKKEIKNREVFLIQIFKRWKGINIILFPFQDS